jgi:hypothetical protein
MQGGAVMYFTPEKLVSYIESGGIIDPSEPASNFLVDVYEIIMGKPPYGRVR